MRERYKLDILAEILGIASGGARKTILMYGANLSFMKLEECLQPLIASGLLEYMQDERIYVTTAKGQQFLQAYNGLVSLLPGLQKQKSETANHAIPNVS